MTSYEEIDAWMRAAEERFGIVLSGYLLPYADYNEMFAAIQDGRATDATVYYDHDVVACVTIRGRVLYPAARKEWRSVVLDWHPVAKEAARGIGNAYLGPESP